MSEDPSSLKEKSSIREQFKREKAEDASFQSVSDVKKTRQSGRTVSTRRSNIKNESGRYSVGTNKRKPRDNSSRFDD